MKNKKIRKVVALFFIVGGHSALLVGTVFALRIGRQRFFGLLIYAAAALIIFDILFILNKKSVLNNNKPVKIISGVEPVIDIRTIIIFLLATITAFAVLGRGWVAYLLASLVGGLLTLRIKQKEVPGVGRTILLASLILSVLILSKIFTVPYLIQTFDVVKHTEIAKTIVESGGINQLDNTRYEGFLIFHVLLSTVANVTSESVRISAGLLLAVIFPASLLATYAFLSGRRVNRRLVLLTIVLLTFSVPTLDWGSKVHYQSLSFVYFTFVLLLINSKFGKAQTVILAVPIFAAWVNTHHLSVFMSASLLAIFLPRDILSLTGDQQDSTYLLLVLYVIIAAKWTVVSSWFTTPVAWVLHNSPKARTGLGSTGIITPTYDSFYDLFLAAFPFFLDYLHLSFLLALTSIGVLIFSNLCPKPTVLFIGSVIGSIFYFPNPLWIPLRGIATLIRWQIIVQVFVLVISAAGLFIIDQKHNVRGKFRHYIHAVFIIVLLFSMISAGFYAPTTSDFVGADRHDTQYLSNQDIETSEWIKKYSTTNKPVYVTSKLLGYISFTSTPIYEETSQQKYSRATVTGVPGRVRFLEGLTVFQRHKFRIEAIRMTILPNLESLGSDTLVSPPVSSGQIIYNPTPVDTVYTNGYTVVHKSDQNR